jgi:hypothetical protein
VYSSYVASLRVQTAGGPIELINVYNPRDNGPETQRRDLHLLNPKGVATWKRGRQESVIDLVFATELLRSSVMYCCPREDWAIAQDHIPIDIQFNIEALPKPPCKRFALHKLDIIRHLNESCWQDDLDPLYALQRALCEGLEANCPRAKPSPRASRKWPPRASELLAGARRARRAYAASGSPLDLHSQKAHLFKKELRRSNRTTWRKFVEDLSMNPELPNI